MAKKFTTTVRLTEEARSLIEALSEEHGLSHTAILEIAVREKAKRDKVSLPTQRSMFAQQRARRAPVA